MNRTLVGGRICACSPGSYYHRETRQNIHPTGMASVTRILKDVEDVPLWNKMLCLTWKSWLLFPCTVHDGKNMWLLAPGRYVLRISWPLENKAKVTSHRIFTEEKCGSIVCSGERRRKTTFSFLPYVLYIFLFRGNPFSRPDAVKDIPKRIIIIYRLMAKTL